MGDFENKVNEALEAIKTIVNESKIGIILSPGFEKIAYGIEDADMINCYDIPNFPYNTMEEAIDNFIVGRLQGKKVIAISGASCNCIIKSKEKSDFLMAMLQKIGVKHLIVINSAVSMNEKVKTNDIVIVKDRMNRIDNKMNSGSFKCDNTILEIVKVISDILNIDTKEVVYACPFNEKDETILEIENLKRLKADVFGLPTILEFISNTYNINIFHMAYIKNVETKMMDYGNVCSQDFDVPKDLKEKYTALLNEIVAVL